METVEEQGIDTLANLEERITRAVQAITQLRNENQQLQQQLADTRAELDRTVSARNEAQSSTAGLQKENEDLEGRLKQAHDELNGLRGERKQVKARIEKLLGQLDLLSAS